jgi:hypothetical protein
MVNILMIWKESGQGYFISAVSVWKACGRPQEISVTIGGNWDDIPNHPDKCGALPIQPICTVRLISCEEIAFCICSY